MRTTILALGTILVATLGLSGTAIAGDWDYGPQASLYLSYAFDGPAATARGEGIRYGFRVDHERHRRLAPDAPPMVRWEFHRARFDHVSIAGVPLVGRDLVLNAEDGGTLEFVRNNLGKIALTVAGGILLYAVVEGESNSDGRDADDIDGPGSVDDQDPEFDCDAEPRSDFCTPD